MHLLMIINDFMQMIDLNARSVIYSLPGGGAATKHGQARWRLVSSILTILTRHETKCQMVSMVTCWWTGEIQ